MTGEISSRAVVRAGETFALTDDGAGRYLWTLTEGSEPGSEAIVNQRLYQFDREDRFSFSLSETLSTGGDVEAGQEVASFGSARVEQRLAVLNAELEVIQARKTLLLAGGRPELVREARDKVALAQALLSGEEQRLRRAEELAEAGALSAEELDVAQLEMAVGELELAVARSELTRSRREARPEEVAEINAELREVETRIDAQMELARLNRVESPISGRVSLGVNGSLLTVHNMERVYLHFPIAEELRQEAQPGRVVRFESVVGGGVTLEAAVQGVSDFASFFEGQQVFWVAAAVEGPTPGSILPGVGGTVTFTKEHRPSPLDGDSLSELDDD